MKMMKGPKKINVTIQSGGLFAALLTLWLNASAAQACDHIGHNNFFSMAESAARVLVVRATDWNKAKVLKALKGNTSKPLPAINTNCDPHFKAGQRYLVFVRPGDGYFADNSAFHLVGAQGKQWTKTAARWIHARDEKTKSKILMQLLKFEFSSPKKQRSTYRMLDEVGMLESPPPLDKRTKARLGKELEERKKLLLRR